MFVSEAGWILPSASDPEPSAGDQSLFEQRFADALLSFQVSPPSARRMLGLGQAHLGLGRFEADLYPLGLRLVRDVLERRAGERSLAPDEAALLDWCRTPQLDGASGISEALLELLALHGPALLQRADSAGPLFETALERSHETLPHPADLVALARLHLRAAREHLISLQDEPFQEEATAFVGQVQELLAPLDAGQAPDLGGGAGPARTCLAEAFRLEAEGKRAEAMGRLQSCNPSQESDALAAADPSWLILRALLRYQEGSCNSYAVAAVDLSVLEKSFSAVRGIAVVFRQMYARECSVGGRLAGG
jgi:hypothetical protein